ncbi:MAG: hypothetical protein WCO56_19405 [Verrucomicrobiota bacterium]
MKKTITVALVAWSVARAALAEPVRVSVDAGTVVRSGMHNAIGINLDYLLDSDAQRPPGSASLTAVCASNGWRCLRYPGGEKADNYLWTTRSKDDPRPIRPEDPVPTPLVPRTADLACWPSPRWNQEMVNPDRTLVKPLGFDAFMALCAAAHAEPVIVVAYDSAKEISKHEEGNSLDDLVASAAAWVKYAKAKGYKVKWWEIGNETSEKQVPAKQYVEHFKRFAEAMRAQDPDARIVAQSGLKAVLADGCANAVVAHSYPMWRWDLGYGDFLAGKSITKELDDTLRLTKGHDKAGQPIPILLTEFNATDWSGSWPNVNDLGHALVLFDMIGQQMSHPEVALTTLWNTRFPGVRSYKPATKPNQVVNPKFEDGIKGWNDGEVVADGTAGKALRVADGKWIFQNIAVSGNETHYFSCWAKVTDAKPWAAVGVDFVDAQEKKLSLKFFRPMQITSTSEWRFVHQAFTVPASAKTARIWFLESKGDASLLIKDVYFDDASIPSQMDILNDNNSLTPTGEGFSMWTRHVRDNLLRTTGSADVNVYATSDHDGVTVWLLNKPRHSSDVHLDIHEMTVAGPAKAWRFTGASSEDLMPRTTQLPDVAINGSAASLILPPLSITVLSIHRQ